MTLMLFLACYRSRWGYGSCGAACADEDEEAFGQRLVAIAGANSSTGAKKPKPAKAKAKRK